MAATFPVHPLPVMQAPFEESMLDATGETGFVPFRNTNKTVKQRQQQLCREERADELSWNFTYNAHWRYHPKGKFHPLLKTVTQIVFGVHLLHQHLEKSVADVADILLKHVNELDGFLQRANEDLESSLKDMLFRHKCLKVPMEHVSEFDRLLEDRAYRAQLLDGNVTIERTIGRMSQMLNDYLTDVSILREANHELDFYLSDIGEQWTYHNDDIGKIYSAMCGNTGGWAQFLQSLVAKAERLGVVLVQVSSYCNEIEKRCGAASRRSLIATRSSSRNSSNSREHAFRTPASNKDLPPVPAERPPFMTAIASGSATPTDGDVAPRQPRRSRLQEQTRFVASPDSSESPNESEESSSSRSPDAGTGVRYETVNAQPEHLRGRGPSQLDSGRSSRMFGHRRHPSNLSTEETLAPTPKRFPSKPEKGEPSPPWTGKDSAYSSVSGASGASPTVVPSRSASAMSSHPQAQFGLFPSNRSTPIGSISGRSGHMSPAFNPSLGGNRPLEAPSRPHTALGNFPDSAGKLSKRSSFTSLKRLFTKKRSGNINSIPE